MRVSLSLLKMSAALFFFTFIFLFIGVKQTHADRTTCMGCLDMNYDGIVHATQNDPNEGVLDKSTYASDKRCGTVCAASSEWDSWWNDWKSARDTCRTCQSHCYGTDPSLKNCDCSECLSNGTDADANITSFQACSTFMSNAENTKDCKPDETTYSSCVQKVFEGASDCSGLSYTDFEQSMPPHTNCVIGDSNGVDAQGNNIRDNGGTPCTDEFSPADVYLGTGIYAGCPGMDDPNEVQLQCAVYKTIDIAIYVFGALIVVMVVVSGVLYTTSMGSPGQVTMAKGTLTGAIIGFVLVVACRFIVAAVYNLFIG